MKYWPLTFVLLAFWIGRVTGAQEKARSYPLPTGVFDRIEAKEIVLISGKKDALGVPTRYELRIAATGISMEMKFRDFRGVTTIDPMFCTTEVTRPDGFKRVVSLGSGGLDFRQRDRGKKGKEEPTRRLRMGISREIEGYAPAIHGLQIFDAKGNLRAALGATLGVDKQTGAATTLPVSTLTLYKSDGTVLEQLPR